MLKKSTKSQNIKIAILIILHLVGLIGLSLSITQDFFLKLTPFNLLIGLFLVMSHFKKIGLSQLFGALLIAFLGFSVEWIGVNTGLVFGDYHYGDVLGIKTGGTPLMIGVNWLLCVMCVSAFLDFFIKKGVLKSKILEKGFLAILGATLLVVLDFIIEPVATKMDFWAWRFKNIPLSNYRDWWLVAFVLILIFQNLGFSKKNMVAVAWFCITVVFFGVLNLTL